MTHISRTCNLLPTFPPIPPVWVVPLYISTKYFFFFYNSSMAFAWPLPTSALQNSASLNWVLKPLIIFVFGYLKCGGREKEDILIWACSSALTCNTLNSWTTQKTELFSFWCFCSLYCLQREITAAYVKSSPLEGFCFGSSVKLGPSSSAALGSLTRW